MSGFTGVLAVESRIALPRTLTVSYTRAAGTASAIDVLFNDGTGLDGQLGIQRVPSGGTMGGDYTDANIINLQPFWITPNAGFALYGTEVRYTQVSGTGLSDTNMTDGVWQVLGGLFSYVGYTASTISTQSGVFTIEIRSSTTLAILATMTLTMTLTIT